MPNNHQTAILAQPPLIVAIETATLKCPVPRPEVPHLWHEYGRSKLEDLQERLTAAEIVIANKYPLFAAQLAQMPHLKLIALTATGYNNVDIEYCRHHNIAVCNVPGYAAVPVAEYVFTVLLALSRNLFAYRQSVQRGEWPHAPQFCLFQHPIRDLSGQVLGIIGNGAAGQGVARIATAFGMTVLRAERRHATSPRPGYTPFTEVLQKADAISLHCPLNAETQHLISQYELRQMKPTAFLINSARGGIVDEAALVQALREHWIAGAAMDVLTTEPPPPDHPLLAAALLEQPNFLLTPHAAWASDGAMQTIAATTTANIEAFLHGEQLHRIV